MKKITFIAAALMVSGAAFAQMDVVSLGAENAPQIIVESRAVLDDCSTDYPSNGFENGFGNINVNEVGDDFVVADGESFTPETVTVNVFSDGGAFTEGTLRFYEDDGGIPGALVGEFSGAVTASPEVGMNFGFPIYGVEMDVSGEEIILNGVNGSESKFWVTFFSPNQVGANFFENSSDTSIDTNPMAFKDGLDPDAAWAQEFVDANGVTNILPPQAVLLLEGQCDALLNVNEALLSQVSVFPNPASDFLNVRVPSTVELSSVVLYDVLGKRTNVAISNGQINVADLSRGVYILNIETTAGSLSQKVVIE